MTVSRAIGRKLVRAGTACVLAGGAGALMAAGTAQAAAIGYAGLPGSGDQRRDCDGHLQAIHGAAQYWTVPAGVTQATFTLYGAAGGTDSADAPGGSGAEVTGALPVTPGTRAAGERGPGRRTNSGVAFGGGGAAGGEPPAVAAVRLTSATVPIRSPPGCWWPAGAAAAGRRRRQLHLRCPLRAALAGMLARPGEQARPLSTFAAKRCPAAAAAGPARPRWAGPAARANTPRASGGNTSPNNGAAGSKGSGGAGGASGGGGGGGGYYGGGGGGGKTCDEARRLPAAGAGAAVPAIPVPRPARR